MPRRLGSGARPDGLEDLLGVGVAAGGLLRVDEVAVDGDLEDAAPRRDQRELLDGLLELPEQRGRQTDGPVRVPSDRAVLDADLHGLLRARSAPGSRPGRAGTMLVEMDAPGTGILEPAPPRTTWDGGGGGWAWLLTAGDTMEAEIVRGLLEAAGVPVALDWRDPSPFAWMYLSGNIHRPVPVYVPVSMLDAARLELLDSGLGLPETEEPPGPPRRELRQRHPVLWLVVAVLTAAAVAWIVVVEVFGFVPCALRLFCV